MRRVYSIILKREKSKETFDLLMGICHNSKNLYNYANYILRQAFSGHPENIPDYDDLIVKERFIQEYSLTKRMGALNQSDYRSLRAQCSQQVVKQVFYDWKSFFKANKAYHENPKKFFGRPRLPKYKEKKGFNMVVYTNQSCSFDEESRMLRLAGGIPVERVVLPAEIHDFQQVRIIPKNGYIKVEIVYDKAISSPKATGSRCVGIDLGVGNLATVTSDDAGLAPLIVNGRPIKSVNQFYNRKVAELRSILDSQGLGTSWRMKRLALKRKCMIDDYFHKSTRLLVDWFVENDIGKVFVGYNTGWKQNLDIKARSKRKRKEANQRFAYIPFERFISMLKYKCEEVGIQLETVGEAYTSKCSALDKEEIGEHDAYVGMRVKRGLFRTADGRRVNADVNGSMNILRLGLNRDIEIGNVFNPTMANVIRDAPAREPTDRGQVACPDGAKAPSNVQRERLSA